MIMLQLTVLLIVTASRHMAEGVFQCGQVRRQPVLDFYLIQTCSRSTMRVIGRAKLASPARCALFALQKQGLAFNFSPLVREGADTCVVCECPEFDPLTSLKKDWRYDYYSLYGYPLPSTNYTCVPKVGVFELRRDHLNFSRAMNSCRSRDGELAHIISESRTNALSSLVKQLDESRGPKRVYVSLEDRKEEGRFITTIGEPLSCYDYRAWGPSEPRDRFHTEDCVALDGFKQWSVINCSIRMSYLCELWPGGYQPMDTTTGLTACVALENKEEREFCVGRAKPEITMTGINKFRRCWRGVKYNGFTHKLKLPALLDWKIRSNKNNSRNGTQESTSRN